MTLNVELTERQEAWLSEQAQKRGVRPAELITALVEDQMSALSPAGPNERALTVLNEIARRQEGRRHTDGSQTEQIIRAGRSGPMYGHDATE
jgi:hypothetical protein